MHRRRRLLVVAVAIATVLLAWLAPSSRARLAGAATVAEALSITSWRPFAPTVTRREDRVANSPTDVYAPAGDAPVVVLVPGAVPAGRDDQRVRSLARALARADRRVVVPELAVYDERLVEADVDRLVDTVLELPSDGPEVVLVGISFGGSLALVAAADPRLDGRVGGVATFGAYADLVGVVQAATTGVSVIDGWTAPWEPDPRAEQVVREQLTALLPPASARAVRAALDADGAQGRRLTAAERAVYEVLANEDPQRTYDLAAHLPASVRARLAVVSPVSVADGLAGVPVVATHSRDDPVIPYGELRRLGAAVPHAQLLTVDGLAHTDPRLTAPRGWLGALDDLWSIWSFASRALRWQEPTLPWHPG